MLEAITKINGSVNDFIWVTIGIWLLFGTGIIMTSVTGFFQFSKFGHWWKHTIGAMFNKKSDINDKSDEKNISQFQALCTALSATVGTGNIAGVAGAITIGGAGAVFWMWLAAIFGMMTNYSENVLGIYYRRKNSVGEWCGGAMYYLKDGLGSYKGCKTLGAILAALFSVFTILASFGIGNLSQVNSIALNMDTAFGIPTWISGIVLVLLVALVIIGGLKRITAVTEKLVPFMVIAYMLGSLVIFICNIGNTGAVFASIFKHAFGVKAAAGGFAGIAIKQVVTQGFKRGIFSNEAGLGSSVMVHSCSNVKEPVKQGMWGIFEVFADTIVVCTFTAFTILSSGVVDLETGAIIAVDAAGNTISASSLVGAAFASKFGNIGTMFIAVAILLFAFSTVLGWSVYGSKAWEYLFGTKSIIVYKAVFTGVVFIGAILTTSLPWDISDTFNGFMMIPNLIGVLALSPLVYKITKNYVDRVIRGKDVSPLLSAFDTADKK